MNIDIGIGYGNVLFGMTTEDVIKVLGQPSKTVTARDDGFEYIYNSLKIKLFFGYEENERLYAIEVFNKTATVFSTEFIGMPFEKFEIFMKSSNHNYFVRDDYDYFFTVYYEELNATFTVEFDEIISVEFSPLFKDDDTILWP